MDRFIVVLLLKNFAFTVFKIQYGQIYSGIGTEEGESLINLKSNMDRFIVGHKLNCHQRQKHLKSNMDRFIEIEIVKFFIFK